MHRVSPSTMMLVSLLLRLFAWVAIALVALASNASADDSSSSTGSEGLPITTIRVAYNPGTAAEDVYTRSQGVRFSQVFPNIAVQYVSQTIRTCKRALNRVPLFSHRLQR